MKNDAWVKMRAAVLALLLVALFGVILWRAGKLQLVEGPRLKQLSERQHQRSLTLVPRRGTIYDRNHEELALSLDVKSVFIRPRKANLDEAGRDRLRRALGLSRKEMARRVTGKKGFVWLKRRVSAEEEKRVRALDLRGIGFINERQRFYPNITLAGSLLGFAGVDSHGLEGVELQYDRYLRGSPEFTETAKMSLLVFHAGFVVVLEVNTTSSPSGEILRSMWPPRSWGGVCMSPGVRSRGSPPLRGIQITWPLRSESQVSHIRYNNLSITRAFTWSDSFACALRSLHFMVSHPGKTDITAATCSPSGATAKLSIPSGRSVIWTASPPSRWM